MEFRETISIEYSSSENKIVNSLEYQWSLAIKHSRILLSMFRSDPNRFFTLLTSYPLESIIYDPLVIYVINGHNSSVQPNSKDPLVSFDNIWTLIKWTLLSTGYSQSAIDHLTIRLLEDYVLSPTSSRHSLSRAIDWIK